MKNWQDKNYTILYPMIRGEMRNLYFPCAIEKKYNGELDFAICDNGHYELVNKDKYGTHRQDLPILDEIKALGLTNYILAGELYMDNGNDLYNFLRNKKSDDLKFAVFDFYEFEKEGIYYKPKNMLRNNQMRQKLEQLFKGKNFKYISLTERRIAKNPQEVYKWRDYFVGQGCEGIVAKNLNSGWAIGRTNEWVKLKQENTADLVVLGYSKKAKYLSLYLGYMPNGVWQGLCNCGSGLTYADKIRFKALLEKDRLPDSQQVCRDNVLVKPKYITEIKYEKFIKDKQGKLTSLLHPVYVRMRNDKTINDWSLK